MTDDRRTKYFEDAVHNQQDITDRYLALGDLPRLVGVTFGDDDKLIKKIRKWLQGKDADEIVSIEELAIQEKSKAERLYRENLIAAVDGTDMVSPLHFVKETIYAVGTMCVTPRESEKHQVQITATRAENYAMKPGTISQQLKRWGEYLQGARAAERSWTGTFREYKERQLAGKAIEEDKREIVLIDGPVVTQNLLTHHQGRELLEWLIASKKAIGFIKDMSNNALLAAIGYALKRGEAFIFHNWSTVLSERFKRDQQNEIAEWIKGADKQLVRAIYKCNLKAYCLECVEELVPLAFAILEYDRSGSMHHDIPMLLQIADTRVRARFNGKNARKEVLARSGVNDPERVVDLTNEREFR